MRRVQDERQIGFYISMTLIVLVVALAAVVANAQSKPQQASAAQPVIQNSVQNSSVAPIAGLISRIGDTTHLEFRGRQQWAYDSPKKENDTIRVVLPPFDDKTVVSLQTWACPLIKKIDVNRRGPDGNYELFIRLADKDVDSFDYLTDDPSYLVFDFYKSKAKEKSTDKNSEQATDDAAGDKSPSEANKTELKKAKAANAKGAAKKSAKTAANEEYKKRDRSPASDEILKVDAAVGPGKPAQVLSQNPEEAGEVNTQFERGIFDGGDPNYNRFRIKDYQVKEEAVIASQQNIYIRYPMLAMKSKRFEELMKNTPIYDLSEENNDENKEARFLLTLYKKARWGAFFKTYDFFVKKHPNSRYDETVKNLAAEAHYRLFQRDADPKDFEAFRSLNQYLARTYPNSVLTERNLEIVAYASLASGDGAETVRNLEVLLQKFPTTTERDFARMAMGEAYVLLNRPSDAIKIYEEIAKNPREKSFGVEAAYRIGDVYFGEKAYAKAIASYQEVLKKYPQFESTYPNAKYNLSESEFWIGHYKQSLNDFIDFVSLFPSHEHGGFALTRIGELLQILGAEQSRVVGAYVESYFRYPNSQGSEVARIRMLSQGLKGMKEREKKRAIEEINEIAKKSTLPQMQEFTTLVIADGLSRRGEYKPALDGLLTYFQKHPTNANLNVFKARILRNLSDILKEDVDGNKYIEALNFYGKYATTWLKNANRIDTDYYQAFAFEQAGDPEEAAKTYHRIQDRLAEIAGTKEEKERRVYEHLPTKDEINLRLAATATSEHQYREAFGYLEKIKQPLVAREEVERVQIAANVAEQMGDIKAAIRNLDKLTADSSDKSGLMVQPELHLSKLYLKEKDFVSADHHLKKLEKMNETKAMSEEQWALVLEMQGDILFGQGQKLAAVQAYQKLLDAYEHTRPLSSIRYKAGKILFEEGDLKGAEKIWNALDDKNGGLYKRLAQEKIHQAEWQDTYRKYIDRIPAAQDLK